MIIKALTTAPISDKHIKRFEAKFPQLHIQVCDSIKDAMEYIGDAEILLTYGEDLTDDIIDKAKNLKWINVLSAGLELMPFSKLDENNVIVTNSKGIHRTQMSEYAMGILLMLTRKSLEIYENQKKKTWDRSIRIDELYGKTLGIVGLGAIGSAIAEKAKAFGMKVIATKAAPTPFPGIDQVLSPSDIDVLLMQSDYVIVLTPLTETTKNMFNRDKFSKMKRTAHFINMSRGAVVVDEDLIEALELDWIAGAVLDVFVEEPLPKESPLWDAKNIIITPHMSGRSTKYMERALEIFEANAAVYIMEKGDMINVVDKKKGY